MITSVLQELTDAAAAARLVTVTRRGELVKTSGFPVAVGSRLVLLRYLNSDLLVLDGYMIVRVQDVTDVCATDWDRAVARALAAEPPPLAPSTPPVVRLDGWASALEDLYALGEFVSVDGEDDEEGYFLGALTALGGDAANMRHIGTDGTWEDSDWTVDHDGITRISFGTRYIQVFAGLAGDLPSSGADE